jgi:hypothetical protein
MQSRLEGFDVNSTIGWIAVAVGIILLLLAFFASSLGLGGGAFGAKHLIVLAVGIIALLGGLYFALMRRATA